jgi:hypothetical protein
LAAFSEDSAIMDISLLQVGLALISAFLVLAGYLIVYENPNQVAVEIKTVANSIQSNVYEVDSYWYEQEKTILFPTSFLHLTAQISQDYILLHSEEQNNQITIPITQKLWIVDETVPWRTAASFHLELFNHTGQYGSRDDPFINETLLQEWITEQWDVHQQHFYYDPLIWPLDERLTLEKCIVFKEIIFKGEEKIIPHVEFVIVRLS